MRVEDIKVSSGRPMSLHGVVVGPKDVLYDVGRCSRLEDDEERKELGEGCSGCRWDPSDPPPPQRQLAFVLSSHHSSL